MLSKLLFGMVVASLFFNVNGISSPHWNTAEAADSADQAQLDHLVALTKQTCLVGTQYDFNANVDGNVSFRNPLKPGAAGQASVDARSSTGAAAIFDQQLRVAADQQTRECLERYMDRIFDYILVHPQPSPQPPPVSWTDPDTEYGAWEFARKDISNCGPSDVTGVFIDSRNTGDGNNYYFTVRCREDHVIGVQYVLGMADAQPGEDPTQFKQRMENILHVPVNVASNPYHSLIKSRPDSYWYVYKLPQ